MRILLYHEVTAETPNEIHAVSRVQFADQMQWLQDDGWVVLPLDELLAARAKRCPALPPRAVAITFDDGYLDTYAEPWPILQRQRYPATVFLVSGLVGRTSEWRSGSLAHAPLLSWQHVREMRNSGITFGSHSVAHRDLAALPLRLVEQELRLSRQTIEQELGEPAHNLAYPYSRFTPEVKGLAGECGYQAAYTAPTGYTGAPGRDLFALQRITILANDSIEEFGRKVRGDLRRRLAWYRRVAGRWYRQQLSVEA